MSATAEPSRDRLSPPAATAERGPPAGSDRPAARRRDPLEPVWLVTPGALTVLLAFQAGGFFAGSPALVATILAALLILRVTLAEHPVHGFGTAAIVAIGGLVLVAVWTLLSQGWSDAPARALLEFDRTLMYLLALILFASFRRDPKRIRWQLRGVALGIAGVSAVALTTQLLPHVLDVAPQLAPQRLSYPLTYWNALGIFAALGIVLCFHLATDEREPAAVRVLGAAAIPLIATTVFFTFSRGAMGAGAVGLVVYALVARPRGLLSGLAAIVPACVVALVAAYQTDLLAEPKLTIPPALSQGRHAALIVALCVAGAAILRVLLLPLDAWAAQLRLSERGRPVARAGLAGIVAALVIVALALHGPAKVSHQFDRFVHGNRVTTTQLRQRLTDPGNNGRIKSWRVAVREWKRHPVRGEGAGTFENRWAKDRPDGEQLVHAHSLYVQTLDELGVVGLLALVVALGSILVGFARRARGPNRALYAALLAAGVTWALHAGVDWDWEMPAVTLWLFALGGAALASRRRRRHASLPAPGHLLRIVISLGVLLLALVPVAILVSQSRLDAGVAAMEHRDCGRAIDRALGSIAVLSVRPEPFEVLGICDARLGAGGAGVAAMNAAVARDPDSWQINYELALVRGASGQDPRPAARTALRLNPRSKLARDASAAFAGAHDTRRWRAIARRQPLPID